ncbi:MAG: hypothetical protein QMD02_09355 [Bacteroidales bacterium]|nr:hypothetical protein [Bacteroidales bacterium]
MKNVLKVFIIIAIIILVSVKSNAQTEVAKIEEDQITKMIQNALFIVLTIEKGYIKQNATNKRQDGIYVWIDHYPSGFEPTQEIIDLTLKLKYVSIYGLTQRQKRKGIYGIAFSGVRIDGNKLILNFAGMGVKLRNNILHIGHDSDGYSFEYEYSCEKQEWVLTKMPIQYEGH